MGSFGWDEFVLNRVDIIFGGDNWLVSLWRCYKMQYLDSRRSKGLAGFLCVYEASYST